MGFETILYDRRDDGVAVVTLNRPDRLNTISGKVLAELWEVLEAIDADDGVRAFLLCGAPRADGRPCFSAGFDLKSIGEGVTMEPAIGRRVTDRIDDMLVPSIAVVDGICSTGGAELAVCCDLRVVGDQAQISDWHLRNLGTGLGGWGASTRWTRLVGVQKAKELFLTGRPIGADEAVRCGWATAQFASGAVHDAALEMAQTIASRNPNGVRMVLTHLSRVPDMGRDEAIEWADQLPKLFRVDVAIEKKADQVLGSKDEER